MKVVVCTFNLKISVVFDKNRKNYKSSAVTSVFWSHNSKFFPEFLIHKMFPKNENGEVKYATEIVLQRLNSKISALNDHPSTLLKNRIIVNRFCVWWLLNVKLETDCLSVCFNACKRKTNLKFQKAVLQMLFEFQVGFCSATHFNLNVEMPEMVSLPFKNRGKGLSKTMWHEEMKQKFTKKSWMLTFFWDTLKLLSVAKS